MKTLKINLFGSIIEVNAQTAEREIRFENSKPTVIVKYIVDEQRDSDINKFEYKFEEVEEIHINYQNGKIAVESPDTGDGMGDYFEPLFPNQFYVTEIIVK